MPAPHQFVRAQRCLPDPTASGALTPWSNSSDWIWQDGHHGIWIQAERSGLKDPQQWGLYYLWVSNPEVTPAQVDSPTRFQQWVGTLPVTQLPILHREPPQLKGCSPAVSVEQAPSGHVQQTCESSTTLLVLPASSSASGDLHRLTSDALSLWMGLSLYAFPPILLLEKILIMIREDQAKEVIVIPPVGRGVTGTPYPPRWHAGSLSFYHAWGISCHNAYQTRAPSTTPTWWPSGWQHGCWVACSPGQGHCRSSYQNNPFWHNSSSVHYKVVSLENSWLDTLLHDSVWPALAAASAGCPGWDGVN